MECVVPNLSSRSHRDLTKGEIVCLVKFFKHACQSPKHSFQHFHMVQLQNATIALVETKYCRKKSVHFS